LGLNMLRFDNRQILTEIDGVVEKIYCVVEQRLELIKLESP
jgi:very-short-patch-repair endonuclease